LQTDIIPNRIQLNMDFIKDANMFMAYNDSNDQRYNMPAINDFMTANNYGTAEWMTISNPSRAWNTPTNSKLLAPEVERWSADKDPSYITYFEQRYSDYANSFEGFESSESEKKQLIRSQVIVMLWQKDPVPNSLGMNVVNIFAPEFALNGTKTAARV